MAGAGAQSTQEALTLAKDAASAGADYACILPPSFFAPSMTPDALESFYIEVWYALTFPIFLPLTSCRSQITSRSQSSYTPGPALLRASKSPQMVSPVLPSTQTSSA